MLKIKDKRIVLDSCILIYACDHETKNSCLSFLKKILKNNTISCSALSGFEVIKNRQERGNEKEYTKFLNKIYRIPIDTPVLMNAATLHFLYKKSGKISHKKGIGKGLIDLNDKLTGDLIIGGTVISYKNHLLLTADRKDYPKPYWNLVLEDKIITTDYKEIKIFLLEPVMSEILNKIETKLQEPNNWPSSPNIYEYRG